MPASARYDVAILLLSWNTKQLTLRCLDSLGEAAGDLTSQVIVVDNASRDGSAEALAARSDIQLIANSDNRGYAAAVNQAYARAEGEFVLLLNSDIEFRPGSLKTLRDFLVEHHEVAGAGPLYLNSDGSPQQHHYRFPTFAMTLANASRILARLPVLARRVREYRMLDEDFSRARPVQQPSASCLLLRRSCLPNDSLMDERYPVYFNDVALAYGLAARGHQLWMTPDAVVVHEHGASTRQLGGALARQHIGAHVRYLRATEPRWRVEVFRAVILVQKVGLAALRRPGTLSFSDLVKALQGDPGPLPQAPAVR